MTIAELYALIDQTIKVNPLATSTDKTRGTQERVLLKRIVDHSETSENVPFTGGQPITAPIPGLQGQPLNGSTEKEALSNLLKLLQPALAPSASISVTNPTRELGDETGVSYTWTATKTTNLITAILVNGVGVTVTGDTQYGSGSNSYGVRGNYTLSVTAGAQSASAEVVLQYLPARYWGASALNPADLTAALASGTSIDYAALGLQKELATDFRKNANYNCSGGKYIHVLYPYDFGIPSLVRSGLLDFSAYTITDVALTDAFGIERDYKLLSTGLQFGAAVNIALIN